MIRGSPGWGLAALAAAVAIHAALGWVLMAGRDVEIERGAGAQEARIGTSFADMAAGKLEATGAEEAAEPVVPDEAQTAEPVKAKPVQADPPEATETPPDAVKPAADALPTLTPQTPDAVAETSPSAEEATPAPSDTAKDVIEAEEQSTVSRSLRPKRRSEAFEKKNEQAARKAAPRPEPRKERQPRPQPRGNAQQDNKAGAASGSAKAKARTSGAAQGSASFSGNAAASNYPGRVMRHLSRVPRPRAGARGTAVVAFSVSDGGGLAGLSIARSSGSGALDRAALDMVRRAAPFPPPPPGARRSFSISIKGR